MYETCEKGKGLAASEAEFRIGSVVGTELSLDDSCGDGLQDGGPAPQPWVVVLMLLSRDPPGSVPVYERSRGPPGCSIIFNGNVYFLKLRPFHWTK